VPTSTLTPTGTPTQYPPRPRPESPFEEKRPPAFASVVYCLDRSGQMDPVGDYLKTDVSKAINKLVSTQTFNVLWFAGDEKTPPYIFANDLVAASEENKSRLFRFLENVKLQGSTDARTALLRAVALRPDLIIVCTDGLEPEVVDEVTAANAAAGQARIRVLPLILPGLNGMEPEGLRELRRLQRYNRGPNAPADTEEDDERLTLPEYSSERSPGYDCLMRITGSPRRSPDEGNRGGAGEPK
jgi:hypothetical protein